MSSHSARAACCCSIAALLVLFGGNSLQNASAEGDTRTISLHHVHTDEELTVTYKVNGRYDEEALRKINNLLRDWRESQPTKMDPHLIDLLWEVHREVGAKEAIWIICGYRSPETNSMLRRRSSGVAQFSQHMLGKAIDFYIPGVPLERLREVGLRAQRGGVGFYPTSGAPFVHMDTGSVRHWPRMPEAQLANILAKGQLKSTVAQADTQRSSPNLFARLFGGGRDEEEDAKTASAPAKAAAPARKPAAAPEARTEKPTVVAAAAESRGEKVATVPLPQGKPAKPESYQVASAGSKPVVRVALASASSETIVPARYEVASATAKPVRLAQAAMAPAAPAGASVTDIINERGYWRGLPSTDAADAPQAVGTRAAASKRGAPAGADPAATASATPWPLTDRVASEPIPNALAYAAQPTPIATARTLPMGLGTSRARRRAAGNDNRGQAQRRSSVIGGAVRHQSGQRGAGGRSLQRSLDARDDREPERAELFEDDTARRHGFPQSGSVYAKAGDDGDDLVLGRSASRHDLRKIRRQRRGLRIDGHIQHGVAEVILRLHRGGVGGAAPQVGETRFAAQRFWRPEDACRIGILRSQSRSQFSMPSACM